MRRLILIAALAVATASAVHLALAQQSQSAPTPPAGLDIISIDRAIGKSGQIMGDVYKISFPRSDLNVSVGSVTVKPGFALGSWAAFRAAGNQAVVHGVLVLT